MAKKEKTSSQIHKEVKLLYVYQTERGWGKGETIAQAMERCKLHSRGKPKYKNLTTYKCLDLNKVQEALASIQVDTFNITFKSPLVEIISQQDL